MAHDVFISYAIEDRTVANAVCATLEAEPVRCWIAPRDVLPGVSYAEALVDAISESSLMVLVFSSRSNNSPQVMREVERAASKGIPILPFRIEDVAPSKTMEFFLSTPHWLDALTPPLEKHLGHLAGTVQLLLSRIRKPEEGTEEAESVQSARAVGTTVERGPHRLTSVRNACETAKRWGRRPTVRLAAVFVALAGAVVGAIFLMVGLLSGGGTGSVALSSPVPGGPSPTAVHKPPASPTPVHGEVVTNVSAKGFGAPGRTTRGIAWDGTNLWLSGDAELFKVDTDGKVLGVYSPPEVTPEGLTWDGATFWISTTNYGQIYQFSIDESAAPPKPRVISSFRAPNRTVGGTNDGLAWDGTSLWYSDSYNVYRLDTAGNVLSSFAFGHEVAGLAWDGQRLWLTYDSFPDNATLVKTDTEGNVLLSFNGPVYQIDALTWGDGHLWAAGADSLAGQPMIYRIDVETTVVGPTPTATPTVIELTPTATLAAPTTTATSWVLAPELGTWSGTTSQGRGVEFDVIEGSRAIGRIEIDVEGECPLPTGGAGPQPTGCTCEVKTETKMAKPWPIADTGFSYAPGDFEFSAVFDSTTTASGFVRVHTSGGAQAPCSSDQVTWTASLQ